MIDVKIEKLQQLRNMALGLKNLAFSQRLRHTLACIVVIAKA